MVGGAGDGIGSHGFGCGSDSGSSTSVDSVVDVCIVVTYDVDSWIKRGASWPAFAGSISPECDILRRKGVY